VVLTTHRLLAPGWEWVGAIPSLPPTPRGRPRIPTFMKLVVAPTWRFSVPWSSI